MKIWLPHIGSYKEGGVGVGGELVLHYILPAMIIWLPNTHFGSFKEGGVGVGGGISTPLYTTSYDHLVAQYTYW